MTGEHLNGVQYESYTGPSEVGEARLVKVLAGLETYQKEKSDDSLGKVLEEAGDRRWRLVGPERNDDAGNGPVVGVRYEKGPLQVVFFENQIMAAFVLSEAGSEMQKLYYLSMDETPVVTDNYSF